MTSAGGADVAPTWQGHSRMRYLIHVDQDFAPVQYRIELRSVAARTRHAWACYRSGSVVPFRVSERTFRDADEALADAEGVLKMERRSPARLPCPGT